MMDFEEGASTSLCSRAGQKRPHSQISSAGHNAATTSLDPDSRSASAPWHRPTTLLPSFTSVPLQVTGRSPNVEGSRNSFQISRTEEQGEGGSRSWSAQSVYRETSGEEADRFMRLQLPPPPSQQRFAGDGFDYRRPISSSGRAMNRTRSPQEIQQANNTTYNAIDLTGSDSEEDEDSGPSQGDTSRSIQLQVPATNQRRSALADYLIQRREEALSHGQQPQRSSRPPRFGRDVLNNDSVEVIDLASEDEGTSSSRPSGENSRRRTRGSPEVQFLSSRQLSPARRRPELPRSIRTRPSSVTPAPADYDFLSEDDWEGILEDVQIVRENPVRQPPRRDRVLGLQAHVFQHIRNALETVAGQPVGRHLAARVPVPPNFLFPGVLDVGTVAFPMGFEDPEPEPATYEAPPEAPLGFTRSPQEDEVLICPNCDKELCSGETEQDRQVWVLKQCGHVYCGTCAANRSLSATKRKERNLPLKHAPFKVCRVDSCGKKCSGPKSMFPLFL